MLYFFYSLYHFFKDLYPLSDYTTGYMNGGDSIKAPGVFSDHGNHTQANTGSLSLISILSFWNYT